MSYNLILENEFRVTGKNIIDTFKNNEVFVLGYGSLLYSSGWKTRNMFVPPKKKDFIECRVNGYERGKFGLYGNLKRLEGVHYYGVIPNKDASFNGVLVKIHSELDWVNLMSTECITGMAKIPTYRCVDVTANIAGNILKPGQVVHMVANEPKNKELSDNFEPALGYYTRVAKGVEKERSLKFKNEFYKTGGVSLKDAVAMYKTYR